MRIVFALVSLAFVSAATRADGQWSLDLEVGRAGFSGTSRDTSSNTANGSFRPYVPALFGFGIARRIHRVTLGVRLSYADGTVALATDGPTLLDPASMLFVQAAPEVGLGIARLGSGASLNARAGPLIEVWALEGEDPRWRVGGQLASSLDCPLGARFTSTVTARLGVTPSVFRAGELPAEFVRRASWRTSVAFGLRYRL